MHRYQQLLIPLAEALLALRNRSDGLIGIYPHLRADGDALGSSLGLSLFLRQIGLETCVFLEEAPTKLFQDLPGQEAVIVWPDCLPDERSRLIKRQRAALMIDVSEPSRLASRLDLYNSAPERYVLDHHLCDMPNDHFRFVFPESAASCELLFYLLEALRAAVPGAVLSKDCATCLYTGLLTDTGNFAYPQVSEASFLAAAGLVSCGVDFAGLQAKLFREISWTRYLIEGRLRSLTERVLIDSTRAYTILTVSPELLKAYGAGAEDIEAMPAIMRDIEGCCVSVMLSVVEDGVIRGNLRSVPDVDIEQFARSLGGGGHKNASGFRLRGLSLNEAADFVKMRLQAYLEQL